MHIRYTIFPYHISKKGFEMCLLSSKVKKYQYSGWKKRDKKLEKHIPFNKELMKPNANFIDERVNKKEKKKNLFSKLINLFG